MENVSNTFNVAFYIRKDRIAKDQIPVCISIILNKKRIRLTSKLVVNLNNWDSNIGYPKGNTKEIKELILKLEDIRRKIFNCYHELHISKRAFNIEDVKNLYFGIKEQEHTLMTLFDYHYETSQNTLAEGTRKHYLVSQRYFKDFIQKTMKKSDIYLSELNLRFVTDFEQYVYKKNRLNPSRECKNNGIMKHIIRLRKVVNVAIRNEWMEKDPFLKYKVSLTPSNRQFLTADELQMIEDKTIKIHRLEKVKDLFIFSCYTGLSYTDTLNLKPENITLGIDKKLWIRTARTKTDIPVNIPILPKAMEILKKYETHPEVQAANRVLPSLSNQRLNSYLKELADLCDINKPLTFHIARHTFATTVTLTNGVPIETVSKLLGHSSIKTTQIYAKVVDSKLSHDMDILLQKLETQKSTGLRIAQ